MNIYRALSLLLMVAVVSFALFFRKDKLKKISVNVPEHSYSIADLKGIKNILPIAVIGSGPAGLSAALYTSRMNMHTVVFKGSMPGGQLTGTSFVENWPGIGIKKGPEIMNDLESTVTSFGAQFSSSTIDRVDLSTWPYTLYTDENKPIRALTIVIATGSSPKRLSIEGEQEFWGKGVSTCAVCDAPFYKEKSVIVVGGGDSAAEMAMELAGYAKSVTLMVRGKAMRASAIMQDRLKTYPNITLKFEAQAKRIIGNENHVTSVELEDGTTIPVDGFFLAIGHDPNTALFKDTLALDEHGYLVVKHPTQETSLPGIFAAGDVVDYRYRQAGVASGDGIKAALDAVAFLREHGFNDTVNEKMQNNYFEVEEDLHAEIPIIATLEEFEREVLHEKLPVVIDFYAPYCPSCMQMLPVVQSVAAKLADTFKFVKVDTSTSQDIAKKLEVTMIPTLLVLKDGKLVSRSTEVMNRRTMTQYLQKSAVHKG